MNWFVYIVRCSDNSLYTGITKDILRRVHEHNHDDHKCARYVKTRRPVVLVYSECTPSRKEAMLREAAIKKLPRKKKLELIAKQNLP
jgi:putative endonuclease